MEHVSYCNQITKIGISSPEDVMIDSSFAEDFINYLEGNKECKTISWMEYETLRKN